MKKDDFVHLHTHSDYSLLDGAAGIDDLVEAARRFGMSALALTDHGNLFGAIEFYRKALEAGIKPIIGYEAYVAPDHRKSREAKSISDASFHLILLAKNEKGYKNLLKLATTAYLEGHYYRPRIDKEVLAEHSKGLVGLSGCLKSEVSHLLLAGARKEALAVAGFYKEIFEDGCYFLEIQNTGLRNQEVVLRGTREIAEELGLPLVATNDVHYISPEDAKAQDALLCINTGKILSDPNRMKFPTNEFYFKTGEEMEKVLGEFPEGLKNTKLVADMCNLELDFSTRHLPHFQASPDISNAQYLRRLTEEGLKERYQEVTPEAKERLNYELSVIERMGLVSYFLIVWDFVRFAKEAEIPVGLRGSGAGSFAAYALGITDIDPLKFDILFERFLDESRKEFPDIDIDLCQERREEVINYVREKYGRENVAQIITFGTLAARGALRDVGRVLNLPLAEVDYLAKKVPFVLGIKLKDVLSQISEVRSRYETEPEIKELFDIAMRLEGLARHASVHAAGVVIADKPLSEYVPLYRPPQGSEEEITTQYPMDALEEIGLLKMDFLGLATLTVIDKTGKMVEKTRGEKVDIKDIPLDDKATFALLSRGESKGVFQFESSGYRDLLKQLKPDRFTDIIALEALYRPGPMASGMVDAYVNRRHGKEEFDYKHPLLKEILGETYGVMAYQDQVMRILNELGGIPLSRALSLIKAISKKRTEEIASAQEDFVEGAIKKGVEPGVPEEIFQRINHFGGYGFAKSHSTAYALISYQTAYLKAHYPVEFMAALLSSELANTEKIVEYIEECRRMDLEVLAPDINRGLAEFSVLTEGDKAKICYGLAAVKNVGRRAVEEIVRARSEVGNFNSLYHLCENVDLRLVNKAVLESLVKCGAFDGWGKRRSQLMAIVDKALVVGSRAQEDRRRGQTALFPTDSALESSESLPDIPEWPEAQTLAYEKQVLGFYMTSHPLAKYASIISQFSTAPTRELTRLQPNQAACMGGMVTDLRYTTPKNGRYQGHRMALFSLEDLEGQVDAVMFPRAYEKFGEFLFREAAVFLKGRLDLRREVPSIKVDEVIPIAEALEKLGARLTIKINLARIEEETLR